MIYAEKKIKRPVSETKYVYYIFIKDKCVTFSFLSKTKIKVIPERHHVTEFCWQAAKFVGGQIQVHQVWEFGDFGGKSAKVVVVDVQSGQMGERP